MLGIFKRCPKIGFILIFANRGSGKTTYAAKLVDKYRRAIDAGTSQYKEIICNQPIKGAVFVESIADFLENYPMVEDVVIICDEVGGEYNNRKMRMSITEIMKFKYSRHYGVMDIILLGQSWEDPDVTLKRMLDKMYFMRRSIVPGHTVMKQIRKRFKIDKETQQPIDAYKFRLFIFNKWFRRKKYFHLFDSFYQPANIEVADIHDLIEQHPDYFQVLAKEDSYYVWKIKKNWNRAVRIYSWIRSKFKKKPNIVLDDLQKHEISLMPEFGYEDIKNGSDVPPAVEKEVI